MFLLELNLDAQLLQMPDGFQQVYRVPGEARDGLREDDVDVPGFALLKHPLEKNKETVRKAERKVKKAALQMKDGLPPKEGLGPFYNMAGFFGQRLYFGHMTKEYSDKLRIDNTKCVGCGRCAVLCPMKNISIVDKKAVQHSKCTMCYRCIDNCPKQAITLLGKKIIDQSVIEKYITD